MRRIQWYHSRPSGVTHNKGYEPQFEETADISEVNGSSYSYKNVKSDTQVSTNNNSDPVQIFLGVAGEDGAPNSNFSKLPELSETSRARKLIFGLQVNDNNII